MKILLDTNVLIHVEDHHRGPTSESEKAMTLLRLAQRLKCRFVVSGATHADFLRATDPVRSERINQLSRYIVLDRIDDISDITAKLDLSPQLSSQDRCDLEILTVLERGAADVLITNDARLRRRAKKIGLGASALDVDEAIDMCSSLLSEPIELLSVKTVQPHLISLNATIFNGLKSDYPSTDSNGGFVSWWKSKVVGGDRDVLLIGAPHEPIAICVLKVEEVLLLKEAVRTLKLCTFKVHESHSGSRLGELLLRASIEYARVNKCQTMYLEVLPKKDRLIEWLSHFGFYAQSTHRTAKGEIALTKNLGPNDQCGGTNSLVHQIDHGPGHFCSTSSFIVPIQRDFHRRLFPELSDRNQLRLPMYLQEPACGNAIRKAYVCHASTKQIKSGSGLFFFQTNQKTLSSIAVIGVVEEARRPQSLDELVSFITNRSVYSTEELAEWLNSTSPTLAILFRVDRILRCPIETPTLLEQGVFRRSPLSIQRVPEDANKWLLSAINHQ